LDEDASNYVRFHIADVGCRFCAANLDDLERAQAAASAGNETDANRRKRYFETSAGHLRR